MGEKNELVENKLEKKRKTRRRVEFTWRHVNVGPKWVMTVQPVFPGTEVSLSA